MSAALQLVPERALGPTGDEILGMLERRRQERGPVHEQMRRIRDAYNGDIIVPLPEMGREEQSSVANLIVTGVDQTAQRIASVMPNLDFPSARPGFDEHDQRARDRTTIVRDWWDTNRMGLKMRRRARYLIGYSSAPAVIRPNYTRRTPTWEVRDPLSAYPAPSQDPDDVCPTDAIFTFYKSWGWLKASYPEQAIALWRCWNQPTQVPASTQVELVEYLDAEVTVLGVLGVKAFGNLWSESTGMSGHQYIELERCPTPGGLCPTVIPSRITLERPRGQFDAQIGMYTLQARLMALEVIAVERGIFPDTYLISRQGETANFISGPHDGRTGMVNVIKGGDIKDVTFNPGFAATGTIDRLERAQRVSGGIPSEFGGESPTNVRTGKRGDAVMAAVTSFPVQEAQEVLAAALEEENKRAIAIQKHCWGRTKTSIYISDGRTSRGLTYTPNDTFDIDANRVTYPMAGADINGLVVGLGQRVGMGMMSKRTAAEIDPMIADPELEEDRVTAEGLVAAVLASLQAQAQQGAIPPADIARIAEIVSKNQGNIFDAIATTQREAQERQANSGAPGSPTGPVAPGAPEAQPGLAMPDQGAEVPTVGAPPEGAQNVDQFLQMLKSGG